MIKKWLAHPLTRGLAVDDPQTTAMRLQIVREKRFLNLIYQQWYKDLVKSIPPGNGKVIEIGSGAGFFKDFYPDAVTTEVFEAPGVELVMDATAMPFPDQSVRAIVMTDVLHHIPNVDYFFAEASRVLVPGGVIAMVEPWVTTWSRLIYKNLHHEPFLPEAPTWKFPSTGPLSGANGALPWIVFERDRSRFENEFPDLHPVSISPMMPLRYLVSGGISMRNLMPGWSYPLVSGIEWLLSPLINHTAMFATVVVQKSALRSA